MSIMDMQGGGVYSLKQERLSAERQLSVIRVLMAVTTSLLLLKFAFVDEQAINYQGPRIGSGTTLSIVAGFMVYSLAVWAILRWRPENLRFVMAVTSVVEVALIGLLVREVSVYGISMPYWPWYIFYVLSVSTRYGVNCSILALAASIGSYTLIMCYAPAGWAVQFSAITAETGFLLVMAILFGLITDRQIDYQAKLVVVNEFRAELPAWLPRGR